MESKEQKFDGEYGIAIIGAGPAGLTAAIYASRYMMNTVVIGGSMGGMIATAHMVHNYPGFASITGMELTKNMVNHVKELGVPILMDMVAEINKADDGSFVIKTNLGKVYSAKQVVLSMGSEKRKLNIPGEKEFLGKGVSYCATCDGMFFMDKVVAVVGGSDSALTAALLLSEYATKVQIIYRKDKFFRAEPSWVKLVEENPKIECIFNSNVTEIKGEMMMNELALDTGDSIKADGVFIEIGAEPNIHFIKSLGVELDSKDYIVTDEHMRTNVEGVFAAGDIRNNVLKQAIVAAGEGSIAAYTAYKDMKNKENN